MTVSVVIPTRNRRAWLALSLRSVLRQRHEDLEAIVVDDGSTDGTAQMLDGVTDPRVRTIHHDAPHGLAATRNDGTAEARGKWVAFVDDDDLWAPDKLTSQVEAAVATGCSWVYVGAVKIDEHSRVVGGKPPPGPEDVARLISHYNVIPGGGSNVMVRRDVLERVGPFDIGLKTMEDWDMWIRLNQRGAPACVSRPLLGKREHSGMMSLDVPAMFESISSIERRAGTTADRGVFHRWIAELCLRNGDRSQAVKHMAIAAARGQAVGVASDAAKVVGRRLFPGRRLPHVTTGPYSRWMDEARAWIEELRDGSDGWPDPRDASADPDAR
jgi:glycosyltransferase involved in cell wall biosynthesis